MNPNVQLIYIDLFCGGGGTTTGVHRARINGNPCAIVAACINHDENAIRSHKSNHKQTLHFTEDITMLYNTSRMGRLVRHVEYLKSIYPDAEVVLWASLECTNFSKAKGGQPRDADSRTLADHIFPYIEALKPDRIQIENVEEFMSWGPLDKHGKPISKTAGSDYIRWINQVKSYGFKFEHRILNSADFGAYTSRRRYFGQFAKEYDTIHWPEQTHSENPKPDLFGNTLQKWNAVKEVIDLNDEGESIFDRKKPLVDATLERTYAGLIKFVAGGKKAFLLKYNSMSQKGKYIPPDIDKPCPVISTQGRIGMVFISAYYGNGDNVSSIDRPSPTLTTKDRLNLVQTRFIDHPWITNTNFNNIGSSVEVPAHTITANRKWQYLVNPQFASDGWSVDRPCFTLIARMDKRPPYLVDAKTESASTPSFIKVTPDGLTYEVYDSDSEIMVKIKEFMAMYGIVDILMRMLRIPELKKIMGFPEDYVLIGTQADQKKFIGNAVEVNVATALVEATAKGLLTKIAA